MGDLGQHLQSFKIMISETYVPLIVTCDISSVSMTEIENNENVEKKM